MTGFPTMFVVKLSNLCLETIYTLTFEGFFPRVHFLLKNAKNYHLENWRKTLNLHFQHFNYQKAAYRGI